MDTRITLLVLALALALIDATSTMGTPAGAVSAISCSRVAVNYEGRPDV